jgi:hypothetical protein
MLFFAKPLVAFADNNPFLKLESVKFMIWAFEQTEKTKAASK